GIPHRQRASARLDTAF
ncbi:pyridoxal-dependent decarboxylase, pyridoxal binding domain protein, partial [Vibrio parahaemolyticus V-223/04]